MEDMAVDVITMVTIMVGMAAGKKLVMGTNLHYSIIRIL